MKKVLKPERIAILILLLVTIVGGWFFFSSTTRGTAAGSGSYSAVFLANNQIYIGKPGKATRDYTMLTDVYYPYYVQAQNSGGREQPKVYLVKLGGEIQGPERELKINTSQILYMEELRKDGPIVKKIMASKK